MLQIRKPDDVGRTQESTPTPGGRAFDPMGAIMRRPWLTAGLLAGTLVLGAVYVWWASSWTYTAQSTVYVSPTFIQTTGDSREHDRAYDTLIEQQVKTVTRFDILTEALTRAPGTWVRTGETVASAAERLEKELTVKREPASAQISISLSGSKPEGLAEVVNAVTSVYLNSSRKDEFYGTDERITTLNTERARIQKEMEDKGRQKSTLALQLGSLAPGDGKGLPWQETLIKKQVELLGARQKRVEAEAQIEALNRGDSGAVRTALNSVVEELVAADPGMVTLRTNLNQRKAVLTTQMSGLTPDHPARKQAETELAGIDKEMKQASDDMLQKAAQRLKSKLKVEVDRAKYVEQQLQADVQQQSMATGAMSDKLQAAASLTFQMDKLQGQLANVDERIRQLRLESTSPGFLRLFSEARTPKEPESGNQKKLIMRALIASFILTFGLVLGLDVADARVHGPQDLQQALGYPPMGMVLEEADAMREFAEEHVFRLSAAIEHASRTSEAKTFVATAVQSGSGTTSVVNLIGQELARSGLKTVVIEANGLQGAMESMDMPTGHGLTDVLLDRSTLLSVLKNGDPYRPARIGIGEQKLLTRVPRLTRIKRTIAELEREYDIILIDAPPLLISADAEYLARSCDATLIVVDSGRTLRRDLVRVAKILERINAPAVGTILNRVKVSDGGADLGRDYKAYKERLQRANPRPNTLGELGGWSAGALEGPAPLAIAEAPRDEKAEGEEHPA
ncbi:MAG: hypothetical protein ABI693_12890 [Bryobacteraceae bacterium]